MPNAIKYSASAQTLALKKGNFWIGTGDVGKGPTSTTDYWNGITPPAGGYTIYLNKASGGPSIYTAANDSQLISLSNTIAGQTFATAAAALAWFATQTDKMVFDMDYEAIITNGLVLNLDAGFTPSYPTTGTTWYDVSSGVNNGTLTNGPTYSSSGGGSIVFDGVDDYCGITNDLATRQNWNSYWANSNQVTFIMVISANFSGTTTQRDSLFGQQYYYGNGFSIEIHGNSTQPRNLGYNIGAIGNFAVLSGPTYSNFTYQPTFISLTHDGTTKQVRFSVNGSFYTATLPQVVSVGNFMNDTTFNVQVARFDRGEGFYNKSFYYLSTYNRVLSDSEVLQNYNALRGRYGI
jgi:hypothetical protein